MPFITPVLILGGPDVEPFWGGMSNINPGRVVGYQVTARKRWRLDFDPQKGVHVNEENFDRPPSQQRVVAVYISGLSKTHVAGSDRRPTIAVARQSANGLANHSSGSEPAMAKTVENVRERIMPWTFRRPHVNRHETWGSYPPTRVTGTARLIRACGVLLVDGDNAIHFGTFSRPASDLDR